MTVQGCEGASWQLRGKDGGGRGMIREEEGEKEMESGR